MDGLTVHPLGKGRFAPVVSPDHRSLRAPLETHDQGASPLEPDERLSRPSTHSPELSCPGTHDQSFRALDNEQEPSCPCTLTRGIRSPRPAWLRPGRKEGRIDRHAFTILWW